MLDKEPLWYPSRNVFPSNPAVSDRQLWAIGMVVVQWSMAELFIENLIRQLIGSDQALAEQRAAAWAFQPTANFWQSQIESKMTDPQRTQALTLLAKARNLNSQRDEVMHRGWGGGMQGGSWAAENYQTTDAALL